MPNVAKPRRDTTERQIRCLQALAAYVAENEYCPSLHEVSEVVGTSHSSVKELFRRLENHGYVVVNGVRQMRITPEGRKILAERAA